MNNYRISLPFAFVAFWVLLSSLPTAAQVVPAKLPKPTDKPPAKNKPAKVYVISGQSNSLGFGRADGGVPTYPSIYLSPDPTIKTCKMPVGSSGLLPMHVYQDADSTTSGAKASVYAGIADGLIASKLPKPIKETTVALGDVSQDLPSFEGQHTVAVEAFIEVPITGNHEVHVGSGDSSYAIATIDGKEVYRREVGGEAVITTIELEKGKRHPLNIVYQKGGSAVFWMELIDLKPKGTLELRPLRIQEPEFTHHAAQNRRREMPRLQNETGTNLRAPRHRFAG